MVKLFFHNTLTDKKELFEPVTAGTVKMYHCGPTVYSFPSIGNMRAYVFADILRRTLEYFGYRASQVINITDVGHLVGDGDDGEDKVEKEAKKSGKGAREIAEFYEKIFYANLADLNIETKNTKFPKASEHIKEQIEIIKILGEKGFTYKIPDGIYFDTAKFKTYGKLGNINTEGQEEGARIAVRPEKRSGADFALWKFSGDKKRLQEWDSPWGIGFPGWHIECSAMSRKYLGQPFDIHTGGIDHIPVHHNNEIAQSECAYETPLARYWLHNEFIKIESEKMSKSLGNIYTLEDLKKRNIHPLSFRYWLLASHYRTPANFTWEAVLGAQSAFEKIVAIYPEMKESDSFDAEILEKFEGALSDDLNTTKALALLQEAKSKKIIDKIDEILGLNIKSLSSEMQEIPDEILEIKAERDKVRAEKDWQKSDKLRQEIEGEGFVIEDQENSSKIRRTLISLI